MSDLKLFKIAGGVATELPSSSVNCASPRRQTSKRPSR